MKKNRLREGRKAVPSSKMPDLGWDIAETQLQKGSKSEEVQEVSETDPPTDSSTPPGNDHNSHTNNNNIEHLRSCIQEIPEMARKTTQVVKSTITKISRNNHI